jgi:hypothetical protein
VHADRAAVNETPDARARGRLEDVARTGDVDVVVLLVREPRFAERCRDVEMRRTAPAMPAASELHRGRRRRTAGRRAPATPSVRRRSHQRLHPVACGDEVTTQRATVKTGCAGDESSLGVHVGGIPRSFAGGPARGLELARVLLARNPHRPQ